MFTPPLSPASYLRLHRRVTTKDMPGGRRELKPRGWRRIVSNPQQPQELSASDKKEI